MTDLTAETGAVTRANNNSDNAIISAWERRKAAVAVLSSPPVIAGAEGGYTPDKKALWSLIDAAEEDIRSTVAATIRGAELQLWTALEHTIPEQEHEGAILREDLDAIDRPDLDWSVRMIVAALRSLRSQRGDARRFDAHNWIARAEAAGLTFGSSNGRLFVGQMVASPEDVRLPGSLVEQFVTELDDEGEAAVRSILAERGLAPGED